MAKVDAWIVNKEPAKTNVEAEFNDLKARANHSKNFIRILLKVNKALSKEIKYLNTVTEARDACLETFKIKESISDAQSHLAKIALLPAKKKISTWSSDISTR